MPVRVRPGRPWRRARRPAVEAESAATALADAGAVSSLLDEAGELDGRLATPTRPRLPALALYRPAAARLPGPARVGGGPAARAGPLSGAPQGPAVGGGAGRADRRPGRRRHRPATAAPAWPRGRRRPPHLLPAARRDRRPSGAPARLSAGAPRPDRLPCGHLPTSPPTPPSGAPGRSRSATWRSSRLRAAKIAAALVGLSLPVFLREATRERDRRAFWTLAGALQLKLLGALARYHVAYRTYGGVADAEDYHGRGSRIAQGEFEGTMNPRFSSFVGSNFVRRLTGEVYKVIGPSRLGGFLVFSWLGVLGPLPVSPRFCDRCPQGARRRYSRLVLVLAVAPLLALQHRQGRVDGVQPRHRRLRGGPRPGRAAAAGARPRRGGDAGRWRGCAPMSPGCSGPRWPPPTWSGGRRARALGIGALAAAQVLRGEPLPADVGHRDSGGQRRGARADHAADIEAAARSSRRRSFSSPAQAPLVPADRPLPPPPAGGTQPSVAGHRGRGDAAARPVRSPGRPGRWRRCAARGPALRRVCLAYSALFFAAYLGDRELRRPGPPARAASAVLFGPALRPAASESAAVRPGSAVRKAAKAAVLPAGAVSAAPPGRPGDPALSPRRRGRGRDLALAAGLRAPARPPRRARARPLAGRRPARRPGGGVVVSFDDGYRDFHRAGAAAARPLPVPAVLYLDHRLVAGEEGRGGPRGAHLAAAREAVATGLVTVGAHTHTHADLSRALRATTPSGRCGGPRS